MAERGEVATLVDAFLPALFFYLEAIETGTELSPLLGQALKALVPASTPEEERLEAILLTAKAAFFPDNHTAIRFDFTEAVAYVHTEALGRAWSLVPTPEAGQALGFWGSLLTWLYGWTLNLEAGLERLRGMLHLLRQGEPTWELAFALQLLGHLLMLKWPEEDPGVYLGEALELFQSQGEKRNQASTLRLMGMAFLKDQRLGKPRNVFRGRRPYSRAWGTGSGLLRSFPNWLIFTCARVMPRPLWMPLAD